MWGGLHATNGISCNLPERFNFSFTVINDFYIYSTTSGTWSSPAPAAGVPAARMMHSAARLGNFMVLFGGHPGTCGTILDSRCGVNADVTHAYNFALNTWTPVNITGSSPTPR